MFHYSGYKLSGAIAYIYMVGNQIEMHGGRGSDDTNSRKEGQQQRKNAGIALASRH